MFERILNEMRENVRQQKYVMTLHAEEEMTEDDYTIFDVENGILTGEIVERQQDANIGEWKYCISGEAEDNSAIEVVAKLSLTGKLVIITVYRP